MNRYEELKIGKYSKGKP